MPTTMAATASTTPELLVSATPAPGKGETVGAGGAPVLMGAVALAVEVAALPAPVPVTIGMKKEVVEVLAMLTALVVPAALVLVV